MNENSLNNMKNRLLSALLAFVLTLNLALAGSSQSLSLEGQWKFALDPSDQGMKGEWFKAQLKEQLRLPGSLQEQGFGEDISTNTPWTGSLNERSWFTAEKYAPYRQPGNVKVPFWLQPEKYYVGAAWYQKNIKIPSAWQGKRIVLRLERPHWGTRAWLDERLLGERDSLSTAHEYELGDVKPGEHRITLRVDNRVLVPVGIDAHSVSDHTQGNWNGVVGSMQLIATDRVWISLIQTTPNVAHRTVQVLVNLGNHTGSAGSGLMKLSAVSFNSSKLHRPAEKSVEVKWTADGGIVKVDYDLGPEAQLWDEFQPALYKLTVELPGTAQPQTTVFGMRQVSVIDKQIALNSHKIFLRGTLECCIFPLHGYPPTDVASWKKVISAARAHGLNHLRFHSWCPPEAAFIAADEMGFYYQVECAAWSHTFNRGGSLDKWIYEESERIVKDYGNHPSFMFMVASNEPGGPNYEKFLDGWVNYWKQKDGRRLYSTGSGWPQTDANQFHITPGARAFPVRALLGETSNDYSGFLARYKVPIVSHEIGQYCVFPNLDEIKKYRGLLKARNFEIVRDFLAQAGMENQARDFLRASGKLQTLFYKDEIEAAMRTPGWGGFQLLDLHDFPGQGTALVGVLDAFWEQKGYVTPDEYRCFCDETVPLARLPKRIWKNNERFSAAVDIVHYGPKDLKSAKAYWRILDLSGKMVEQGTFSVIDIATGGITNIGKVELPLNRYAKATGLCLQVGVTGTRFHNDWNFWVYPDVQSQENINGMVVCSRFDEKAQQALENGETVVLLVDPRTVRARTTGRFDPIFWNKLWFPTQPQHTLGLLMDPKHPALSEFPTAFHSDWQWQDLQNHSRPMVLDQAPKEFRPIVQVIDDWNLCRKLGLVFEAKVAKGRLLVCSIDLTSDLEKRPAAAQLRKSLLSYAASKQFKPRWQLEIPQIQSLFRDLNTMEKLGVRVKRVSSAQDGYGAGLILDGDPASMWHTPWGDGAPTFPHEVVIELEKPIALAGVNLLPRQDGNPNGWIKDYAIYVGDNVEQWSKPVVKGTLQADAQEKEIRFPTPATGKYVKLVALSSFRPLLPFASLAELVLVPQQ